MRPTEIPLFMHQHLQVSFAGLKIILEKLAKSKADYSFALLIARSFFLSEKQCSLFPPEQPMYRNMSQQP
jgi:hypothetical protein